MKVKVYCPCSAKYEFEVEPVHGRMPYAIKCPVCQGDGTELANQVIAQQPSAVPVPSVPAPPAAPIPPPSTGLRVRVAHGGGGHAPASPAPVPVAVAAPVAMPAGDAPAPMATGVIARAAEFCPKHPKEVAEENCRVCGKPICLRCMEKFGYVCSVYCNRQAEKKKIVLPVYEFQRTVVHATEDKKATRLVLSVVGVLAFFALIWAWYTFSATKPKVVYSQKITAGQNEEFALTGPREFLQVNNSEIALVDFGKKKKRWTTALPAEMAKAENPTKLGFQRMMRDLKRKQGDDLTEPQIERDDVDVDEWEDFYPKRRQLLVTDKSLWLFASGVLLEYDRATGQEKSRTQVPDPVVQTEKNRAGFLVVSAPKGSKVFTFLDLATGQVKKEEIKSTPPTNVVARATAKSSNASDEDGDFSVAVTSSGDYLPAGPNLAHFKSEMLQKNMVAVQAMRNPDKPAISEKLTAAQSLSATKDLLNEMKRNRTGGVKYTDESKYRVTLERFPSAGTPLVMEVIGPPEFLPLPSLDLVAAGKSLTALDKSNRKLWSAALTYAAGEEEEPAVEFGDMLFFFDQGMLTAYEAKTGNVRWRLTSVGISSLQPDGKGHLYVATTTASPDDLKYSEDLSFERVHPQLIKVDAKSGKILWKSERVGEGCFISGDFVYTTRSQVSSMERIGRTLDNDDGDVPTHFRLFRIDPDSGDQMWEFYQRRRPSRIEVHQNRILLQFANEVKVLKFFSF